MNHLNQAFKGLLFRPTAILSIKRKKMKLLAFVLLTMFIYPNDNDNDKYEKAYNYLNQCNNLKGFDKKLCKKKSSIQFPINVIDEVYPLSILIFEKAIIDKDIIPKIWTKQVDTEKLLIEFDKQNNFEPFVNTKFKELFKKNENSQIYVAFSKPIGNLLFAELAYNLNNIKSVKSITEITRFNRCLAILFIYDENGEIKDVKMSINQFD